MLINRDRAKTAGGCRARKQTHTLATRSINYYLSYFMEPAEKAKFIDFCTEPTRLSVHPTVEEGRLFSSAGSRGRAAEGLAWLREQFSAVLEKRNRY
jgi:hypothetical protein